MSDYIGTTFFTNDNDSGSNTYNSIASPPGAQAGDFLLCLLSTGDVNLVPQGWSTLIAFTRVSPVYTNWYAGVFYKVHDGSSTLSFGTLRTPTITVIAYRNATAAIASALGDQTVSSTSAGGANVTSPGITIPSSVRGPNLIRYYLGLSGTSGGSTNRVWTTPGGTVRRSAREAGGQLPSLVVEQVTDPTPSSSPGSLTANVNDISENNYEVGWGAGFTAVVYTPNGAPGTPEVFTSPVTGTIVNTVATVAAGAASDPDGDALEYEWDLSFDNGSSYTAKRSRQAGSSWSYDYTNDPATENAVWRVRAWDGNAYGPYRYSSVFTIQHTPYVLAVLL